MIDAVDSRLGVRGLWWLVGILGALSLTVCTAKGADGPPDPTLVPASRIPGFPEVAFRVQPAEGKGLPSTTEFCGVLADNVQTRAQGLQGRTDLAGYDGMVFRYEEDSTFPFHMRTVGFPLSIAWFDRDGRFVSSTDMEACPGGGAECATYTAAGPYRYALEVPKGGLPRLGIGPDSVLEVGGTCPRASG
jgi:uncharacterized membrane protein (UPF0127 family)